MATIPPKEGISDAAPSSLDRDSFREQFDKMRLSYERLGSNVADSLRQFFLDADINFLDIGFRTKAFDAACEKYDRKQYNNTTEIEDLCGVRIICYYPSDIERIAKILKKEFEVQGEEDTAQRLAPHEFGYRSTHFVLKLKDSWLGAPTYRALGALKFEVQVRTVLMHAWAEIQHKLAYKNSSQVPDQFHRKLYRLSAKFEEADEQFEEIRAGLKEYREEVRKEASTGTNMLTSHGLNLDTLQAFLDATFPKRARSLNRAAQLLSDLNEHKLKMSHLVEAAKLCAPFLDIVEKISRSESPYQNSSATLYFSQCGAIRKCLDIANPKFYEGRAKILSSNVSWSKSTAEGKRLLAESVPTKKRLSRTAKLRHEGKADRAANPDVPKPPHIPKNTSKAEKRSGQVVTATILASQE